MKVSVKAEHIRLQVVEFERQLIAAKLDEEDIQALARLTFELDRLADRCEGKNVE